MDPKTPTPQHPTPSEEIYNEMQATLTDAIDQYDAADILQTDQADSYNLAENHEARRVFDDRRKEQLLRMRDVADRAKWELRAWHRTVWEAECAVARDMERPREKAVYFLGCIGALTRDWRRLREEVAKEER